MKDAGEPRAAARAFGFFFCVFASWYLVRPVRDAMGLVGNARALPRMFLLTLAVMLVLSPVISVLLARFSRRTFLAIAYRFAALTLLAFLVLLRGEPAPFVAGAFFVWASVLNLLMLSLAWALLADGFTREQGVRLFGLIGGGGTLGAMLGALAASELVERFGTASPLAPAALLLEVALALARPLAPPRPKEAHQTSLSLRGLMRVLGDRFFLALCAYLLLFTFSSTVLYLEQAQIVNASLASRVEQVRVFARMDFAVNGLTLLFQLTLVGRLLQRLGVAFALALLPLLTFGCVVAMRSVPSLTMLMACQVARRVLDYSLARPAREVLFTNVAPDEKYRAKTFIDTFVYRGGDALGALGLGGSGTPVLLATMAIVCAAWTAIGLALGRHRAT